MLIRFLFVKILVILLLTLAIPIQLYYLYSKSGSATGSVAGIKTFPYEISQSASIGDHRFLLYGYTSPHALVSIDAVGVSEQTQADSTGYFEFSDRFSPFSPREVCLNARDQLGRISAPVCLPPFSTDYDIVIGPVLMAPTVSLNRPEEGSDYLIDDEIILSGQTIPDTEVNLSVFTAKQDSGQARMTRNKAKTPVFEVYDLGSPIGVKSTRKHGVKRFQTLTRLLRHPPLSSVLLAMTTFAKPVEAFSFPQLTTKSDSSGNFSLSLPSSKPDKMRVFAQAKFKKSDSPKSNSLALNILPIWMLIITIFRSIIAFIKPRLIEFFIVLELGTIAYFIYKHFLDLYKLRSHRTIVPYHRFPLPMIEDSHPLLVFESKRPV